MVTKNIIIKALDEAIVKCKPKYESMRTVKQIAKYFGYKYEGLLDEIPNNTRYSNYKEGWNDFDLDITGKVHKFVDPKNDNLPIYVFDDLLDKKTGRLMGRTYKEAYIERDDWYSNLDFDNMSDKDMQGFIDKYTYPLKQFFKDYNDLPEDFKKGIGELVIDRNGGTIAGHTCPLLQEGKYDKSLIIMHRPSIEIQGVDINKSDYVKTNQFDNEGIRGDMRYALFHEASHGFSHYLGYNIPNAKWDAESDFGFLQRTSAYKKGRKADEKLTGDRYAGDYATTSKSFDEDQADMTALMLLKATSKTDSNYSKRVMFTYPKGGTYTYPSDKDYVYTIDDFLKRYPNRVEALNKYMNLEL